MDYQKHYNRLIFRARFLDRKKLSKSDANYEYFELHHIIPRCMGGLNDKDNLVLLTPEEHYLAHQLLVKIYPSENKLVYAVNMMTIGNNRNNKLYGWLRRRLSKIEVTEETKEKIRQKRKLQIFSDETRKKISLRMTGYKFSAQRNEKMRKSLTNVPKKFSRTVVCIELDCVFQTYSEAARFIGLGNGGFKGIKIACENPNRVAGGYHWRYLVDNEDITKFNIVKNFIKKKAPTKKKILCVETGEIFESATQASKKYSGCIDGAARGAQKTAGGYQWKYIKDDIST